MYTYLLLPLIYPLSLFRTFGRMWAGVSTRTAFSLRTLPCSTRCDCIEGNTSYQHNINLAVATACIRTPLPHYFFFHFSETGLSKGDEFSDREENATCPLWQWLWLRHVAVLHGAVQPPFYRHPDSGAQQQLRHVVGEKPWGKWGSLFTPSCVSLLSVI